MFTCLIFCWLDSDLYFPFKSIKTLFRPSSVTKAFQSNWADSKQIVCVQLMSHRSSTVHSLPSPTDDRTPLVSCKTLIFVSEICIRSSLSHYLPLGYSSHCPDIKKVLLFISAVNTNLSRGAWHAAVIFSGFSGVLGDRDIPRRVRWKIDGMPPRLVPVG